jgi:hypothetical protein
LVIEQIDLNIFLIYIFNNNDKDNRVDSFLMYFLTLCVDDRLRNAARFSGRLQDFDISDASFAQHVRLVDRPDNR